MIRILTVLSVLWAGSVQAQDVMRMAVTTSFHNSGLAEVLLPQIEEDTGITVQLLVVGTGQALKLGRAGDVDAILVHSRAAEDVFVAEGYSPKRTEVMYNDFVIVGPTADPAKISNAPSATDALGRIARAEAPFVSRGDDSGTHRAERALWSAPPDGAWYSSVGAGMGAALNTASGLGAYILTDRASWLNFGNPRGLALLFEGDPALFNQYAYLSVSPAKHPHIKADLASKLETWLTSQAAQAAIDGYRVNGQQLFTFNADP